MPELNNIQTWLRLGGVTGSYATMQDILADTTALNKLMTSGGAVNYLVGCDDFISEICASSNGMSAIGASNYCANSLLPHNNWLDGICNSTYFESVLNVKVPTMTSNTTPSGVASASTSYSGYYAYQAFDKNNSTHWVSNSVSTNSWVQYKFTRNIKIYGFIIVPRVDSEGVRVKNFEIRSSRNNFSSYNTEYTGLVQSSGATFYGGIANPHNADCWRLHIVDTYGGACSVCELNFYGRENV